MLVEAVPLLPNVLHFEIENLTHTTHTHLQFLNLPDSAMLYSHAGFVYLNCVFVINDVN